jgi:hypothetical protein
MRHAVCTFKEFGGDRFDFSGAYYLMAQAKQR